MSYLPKAPRQVPMRSKGRLMKDLQARKYADYRQAASLLLDKNLEWSADIESIRVDLGKHIAWLAESSDFANIHISGIVRSLIAEENDMSI
jgi:hypothetical protein